MEKCKDCGFFGGYEGTNVWCNAGECKYKKKITAPGGFVKPK